MHFGQLGTPEYGRNEMSEKDPVTGYDFSDEEVTQIDDGNARAGTKYRHEGKWFYFKSLSERQKFIGNPDAYLGGD
jgi:YHS domain-containing protein